MSPFVGTRLRWMRPRRFAYDARSLTLPLPVMTRPLPLILTTAALFAAALLTACGEAKDPRPDQPVAHRRVAFKNLMRGFEPMGVMLRENRYDPDKFKAMADKLGPLAEAPWPYFLPDTLYPPSKALPAVWSEPDKFAQRRQAFQEAARALVAAAQTRDEDRIAQAYEAVHGECRGCHDAFKSK